MSVAGWIVVGLVGVVLVIVVLARVFGSGDKGRPEIVKEAKTDMADIKAAADAQLQAELAEVDADKGQLAEITKIEDDTARLDALAKYSNRRRGG